MSTVNVHAAKTHLSRLVQRAAAGEEIIIAKAGTPLAKLGSLAPCRPQKAPPRASGRTHGNSGRFRCAFAGRYPRRIRRPMMRLLLDTHVLLWALIAPRQLGKEARRAIEKIPITT